MTSRPREFINSQENLRTRKERKWSRPDGSGEALLAHVEELLAAALLQLRAAVAQQLAQALLQLVADGGDGQLAAAVGAAQRLRDDVVDDPEAQQVLRGEAQRLGGLL